MALPQRIKKTSITTDHYQINIIHQRNGKKHKYDATHHKRKRHRSSKYGSITNVNDEGIENILTEMKQMNRLNVNENENEESSSFTIKSGDVFSPKKEDEDEVKVGGDGHVLVSTNTKGFQLPKAKTKGGWL
eukprot:932138_1